MLSRILSLILNLQRFFRDRGLTLNRLNQRFVYFLLLICWVGLGLSVPLKVYSQQSIANPLVRPANLSRPNAQVPAESEDLSRDSRVRDPSLERQAAISLSQEQLSIEQQRLNNPLVPAPLVEIFRGMNVVAHYRDAVVLRNNSRQISAQPGTDSAGSGANQNGVSAIVSSNVLRFRVNKITEVRGYKVRASIQGPDVMVDWFDPSRGDWANVYFGTLQSGFSTTAVPTQLEEKDTGTFDYLKPELRGITSSASSSGSSNSSSNSNSSSAVGFSSTIN